LYLAQFTFLLLLINVGHVFWNQFEPIKKYAYKYS
jgi:hypothetical protein